MSRLLNFFRSRQPESTASLAKERLQLIIAHEGSKNGPEFLPRLKQEILAVVAKYAQVSESSVTLELQRQNGTEVLELNLVLEDRKA